MVDDDLKNSNLHLAIVKEPNKQAFGKVTYILQEAS